MAASVYANTLAVAQANDIKLVEYWDKYLLEMIKFEQDNFVFTNLGVQKVVPRNAGTKTISFRRYNSLAVSSGLTAEALTEGTPPTPLRIEAQKVQGAVSQFGAYIEETDVEAVINMDDIKSIYMPELSRHAAEVIERNIIASFSDASEYYVVSKTGVDEYTVAATYVLTLKEMRKCALVMRNQNRAGHSKFQGKPVFVVHSNIIEDLLDDADLKDRVLVPGNDNSVIRSGSLQKYMIYGFYIIETLIAPIAANSTPLNVYTSYMLGKDPYAVISLGGDRVKFYQTGFTAEKNDPLAQRATFGYKLWTGAKVLDPMTITKIYSTSVYDEGADFTDDPIGRNAVQGTAPYTLVISGDDPATETGTKVWTATLLDANSVAVTDFNAFHVVWTSATVAKATIAWLTNTTATLTGVDEGTSVITAVLHKVTAAGDVVEATDTQTATVPAAG